MNIKARTFSNDESCVCSASVGQIRAACPIQQGVWPPDVSTPVRLPWPNMGLTYIGNHLPDLAALGQWLFQ